MDYVFAPEGAQPKQITLRDLTRRLTRKGDTSPPDFVAIEDETLCRARLADYQVFPLTVDLDPDIDRTTEELGPAEIIHLPTRGWVQRRPVRALTPGQISAREIARKLRIRDALEEDLRQIADPVFMKYQAGEATRDDWLATRQMVRDWYADHA